MNYSGFTYKKSIIHRMNPSLKFLTAVFVVAMIFIPFGFVYQAIILAFCLSLYFLAKLPLKKLWRIIQSVLILGTILILINWITYKTPGAMFDFTNSYSFLYKPSFLNWGNPHITISSDGKYFLQGSMYGGQIITSSPDLSGIKQVDWIGNGFFKITIPIGSKDENINTITKQIMSAIEKEYPNWNIKSLSSVLYKDGNGSNVYYVYFCLTKWYTFSSYAITLMLYVTIKIFLMILIVTILTATTSSIQLTCALEDILNPLRYLRLPVTEWSMTIALVLRFIPSLLDESNTILKAQASRGLDFKNGSFKDKVFSLSSLVVPLFSIAFKKAGELSNAMEARGYNPRASRTRYRDFDIAKIDWIIFLIPVFLLGVLVALIFIDDKKIFLSFGFWDIFA